jgi:hypothetical protein
VLPKGIVAPTIHPMAALFITQSVPKPASQKQPVVRPSAKDASITAAIARLTSARAA